MSRAYTSYPRPVLWLVPEGELEWERGGGVERAAVAPFYLSTLPVTNRQLEAFEPSRVRGATSSGDDDPAIGVSREEAEAYCRWYGAVARKAIRLPSEAEWEHACRAGGEWPWRDLESAGSTVWHAGNSAAGAVPPLTAKPSNGFGLHAMLGGVWEWVAAEEGRPPVLRGGSWRTPLSEIARHARRLESPGARPPDAGFRIAKSLRG